MNVPFIEILRLPVSAQATVAHERPMLYGAAMMRRLPTNADGLKRPRSIKWSKITSRPFSPKSNRKPGQAGLSLSKTSSTRFWNAACSPMGFYACGVGNAQSDPPRQMNARRSDREVRELNPHGGFWYVPVQAKRPFKIPIPVRNLSKKRYS